MQQFTLSELWDHMGPFARAVVFALGAMSLSSAAVTAERAVAFLRSRRDSLRFIAGLERAIGAEGLDAAALAAAEGEARAGHVGRVLAAGLAAYRATGGGLHSPGLTLESVARALERQAQREHQTLRAGLGVLATVASTAPFVGLLGTVAGILQTFGQIKGPTEATRIIELYAPAITATGSGLFMALINILPTWVVLLGRELILALGGGEPVAPGELPT